MGHKHKEVDAIIDQLLAQRWRVEYRARGTKYLAWPPGGRGRPVPIHLTPGDWRWRANLVGVLRRAGAQID